MIVGALRAPRALLLPALLVLLLVGVLGSAAVASAATPRTSLEAVEAQLMCVTCKTPLNQSDARQADEERGEIQRLVDQGKTKDQAVAGMVAIYGDQVLIDPPQKSVRTARTAIPVAAAVIGLVLLVVLVRRWRRRARDTPDDHDPGAEPDLESSSSELTDDDQRRLDADLGRYA